MKQVVFAWKDRDGLLRISHPNWKAKKPRETDNQFLERIASKLSNPVAINPSDLPKSRKHRRFWQLRDGKVVEIIPGEGGEMNPLDTMA
jgi:hypothetical protein